MKTILWILMLMAVGTGTGHAQHHVSPYRLSRHDAWAAPAALALAGGGWYAQSRVQALSPAEIAGLDVQAIPGIDRFNAGDWRPGVAQLSNVLAVAGCASPLVLFVGAEERQDFWKVALMGAEAGLTAFGATNLTKGLAQRARPYLYGTAAPLPEQVKPDARLSFFSSHTSLVATATFFGARVFSDYHHDSKLRPWVWAAAAAAPAAMGYLRIRAGRHFLTDVVTGYALGAAVGYLVPRLHRNNVARNVSMAPAFWKGGSGVVVNWVF